MVFIFLVKSSRWGMDVVLRCRRGCSRSLELKTVARWRQFGQCWLIMVGEGLVLLCQRLLFRMRGMLPVGLLHLLRARPWLAAGNLLRATVWRATVWNSRDRGPGREKTQPLQLQPSTKPGAQVFRVSCSLASSMSLTVSPNSKGNSIVFTYLMVQRSPRET